VRRIGLAPQVPHHRHVDGLQRDRQLALDEEVHRAGGRQEAARQHGEQVGARDHAASGGELVHREHDAPLQALGGQCLVDEAVRPAREAHEQVVRGDIGLERERARGRERVIAAHHADVLGRVEVLVAQRGLRALRQ
jgi:hypothetical protein